ncbi:uncharacterized protein DFL_006561 [Arthrobotrys flagrans]|uniref:Uncharacterized protein n=1 Tax=Arthrobotrys flagrans TaxID=97331 RepID=A0A436ZT52_ARTFL|nr:hypothetical protein DFL_006561 [Arthrobotrys flagrans]
MSIGRKVGLLSSPESRRLHNRPSKSSRSFSPRSIAQKVHHPDPTAILMINRPKASMHTIEWGKTVG